MSASTCVFCRIVAGELPAKVVAEDDLVLAFRDINPQAPTHVLVIPRQHIPSANALTADQAELVGHMLMVARDIAAGEGLSENGYRLVINTGPDGGQTVDHIHVHVLGGRPFGWPPG